MMTAFYSKKNPLYNGFVVKDMYLSTKKFLNFNLTPTEQIVNVINILSITCLLAQKLFYNLPNFKYIWQQHRLGEAGRNHSGSCGPTSLLQQGCPRTHFTGLYPDSS